MQIIASLSAYILSINASQIPGCLNVQCKCHFVYIYGKRAEKKVESYVHDTQQLRMMISYSNRTTLERRFMGLTCWTWCGLGPVHTPREDRNAQWMGQGLGVPLKLSTDESDVIAHFTVGRTRKKVPRAETHIWLSDTRRPKLIEFMHLA